MIQLSDFSYMLRIMLGELGFPLKFIDWIMACVQSVTYSILVNGKPTPPFNVKKGFRQGDLLSPFLFAFEKMFGRAPIHS